MLLVAALSKHVGEPGGCGEGREGESSADGRGREDVKVDRRLWGWGRGLEMLAVGVEGPGENC